jgi:hypothetical protein
MTQQNSRKPWMPEILYEEDELGEVGDFPFIDVPETEKMPALLWIWESRRTGEFEPGLTGEPVPIVDRDLHQYVDMKALQQKLTPQMFDVIRMSLGLKPLAQAVVEGHELSKKVITNVSNIQNQVAAKHNKKKDN